MSRSDFVKMVGAHVFHITPRANINGITKHGLVPPSEMNGGPFELRTERAKGMIESSSATLNHQLPLLAGRASANAFLDGHSLKSWASQLDLRVFFWPSKRGKAFAQSLDEVGGVMMQFESAKFYDLLSDRIDISPINSGNATRKPAIRGDWLYVPATRGRDAFAKNRQQRGLVRGRDHAVEVFVRGAILPEILREIQLGMPRP